MNEYISNDLYKLNILSISADYPNSEIGNLVYTFEWADSINLIYSRKNVGIYIYNAANLQTKTLIEGNDNFNIKEYKDGVLTYDNGKTIKVKM